MHYFEHVNREATPIYNQSGECIAYAYKYSNEENNDKVTDGIYNDNKLPMLFYEKQGKFRRYIVVYESAFFKLYQKNKRNIPKVRLKFKHFNFMRDELLGTADTLFPEGKKFKIAFVGPSEKEQTC